jgi:hypothetical protein
VLRAIRPLPDARPVLLVIGALLLGPAALMLLPAPAGLIAQPDLLARLR